MPQTPENQIRTRARNLKIGKCYINSDWEESRIASIFVTREHVNGNLTAGLFLVDLASEGVIDTDYGFNMPPQAFRDMKDNQEDPVDIIEIDYPVAHNIIYGALAFAEESGFRPHKKFEVAQFILEEDTDDIPLIEVEFGINGQPAFIHSVEDEDDFDEDDLDEDDFDEDDFPEDDLDEDMPGLMEGWDDDIDEMGVPEWGIEEWKEYFDRNPEVQSFRVLQYYADRLFYQLHQELIDIDSFEVILGDNRIEDYEERHLSAAEEELRDRVFEYIDEEEYVKALSLVSKNLERFPEAAWLHHYHFASLLPGGAGEETREAFRKFTGQFADNLGTRNLYGEYFLMNDMADRVPEAYDERVTLRELYPDGRKLKKSDVASFCSNWCWYFLEKNDLLSLDPYYQMLDLYGNPEEHQIQKLTIFRIVFERLTIMEPLAAGSKTVGSGQ